MIGNYSYKEWLKLGKTLTEDEIFNLVEKLEQLENKELECDILNKELNKTRKIIEEISSKSWDADSIDEIRKFIDDKLKGLE